ncbi:ABC transporter permease [Faecalicatena orotica]|uniref:Sodium transport system permease protein n=1 Tax=Faecalicatena orotica TaxID=1544 RepID=A0A2Y9BCQ5_9FIRM|nr:ABC transporter permease [Faecalicatena orotica]PWJ29711.1 sodium transport system permease protein [Faecalicatena orotica]SSA55434.1 sodium transport system permease protein [Faecalicatena orotica]
MSGISQICRKELARVFKDKKMIFSVFLLPVLIMVGIMTLVSSLSTSAQNDVEAHNSIVYVQNAPDGFEDFLRSSDKECEIIQMSDRAGTEDMIRDGNADLLIEFPEGFMDAVTEYKAGDSVPQIKTYYNPSEDYSRAAYDAISSGVLENYRETLLADRVEDMAGLTVFTVNSDNPDMVIQDEEKAGGKILGMMLPYFITILLFAGAMGIGTDMVAGEKERGTMASLLVSPIKRSSIVLGKVFSLMIISGVSSVVYVGAMVAFMPQMMGGMGGSDLGVNLSLNPAQIGMLAALLIAIAFMYSAIIVLVSVFAKTVKEANSYIMPVYMLVLVLGITTMFTTKTPQEWLYAVPIYNTSLTLQGILTQEVTMMQYGLTLGVTLVLGAVLIGVIAKAFESEKVMSI